MTAYASDLTKFAVGRRVNAEEWNGITRVAGGDIRFGVPVIAGNAEGKVVELSGTSAANVIGISETSQVLPHPEDKYVSGDNVGICEFGVIAVKLGNTVTAGDPARWAPATGTWNTESVSGTNHGIPGAQFEIGGGSGDIVPLRYRRPIPSLSVVA